MDVEEPLEESMVLLDIEKDFEQEIDKQLSSKKNRKSDASMDKYRRNSNYAIEPEVIKTSEKQSNFEKFRNTFFESENQRAKGQDTPSFQIKENHDISIDDNTNNVQEQIQKDKQPSKDIKQKLREFRQSLKPIDDINLDLAEPESQLQPMIIQRRDKKRTSREDRIMNLLKPSKERPKSIQSSGIKNPILPSNVLLYGKEDSENSIKIKKNIQDPQLEQRQNKIINLLTKNQNTSYFDQKDINESDDLLADFDDSSNKLLLKQIPDMKIEKKQEKKLHNFIDQDISEIISPTRNREEVKQRISLMADSLLQNDKNSKQKLNKEYEQNEDIQKEQNEQKNTEKQNMKKDNLEKIEKQKVFNTENYIKENQEQNFSVKRSKGRRRAIIESNSHKIKNYFQIKPKNDDQQQESQDTEKEDKFQQDQRRTVVKNEEKEDKNFKIQNQNDYKNIQVQYEFRDSTSSAQIHKNEINFKKELQNLTQEISKIISTHNFQLMSHQTEKKIQRSSLKFKELKKIVIKKYLLREKIKRKKEFYSKIQSVLDQKLTYLKSVVPTKQKNTVFQFYQKTDQEKILKKYFCLKLMKVRILPRSNDIEFSFVYKQKLLIFLKKKQDRQIVKGADTNLLQKFDFFDYTENTIEEDKRKFEEILGKFYNQRSQKCLRPQVMEHVLNELCYIYTQLNEVVQTLTKFLHQQKIKNLDFNRNSQFEFEAQPRKVPFINFKFTLQTSDNFQWNLTYFQENKEQVLTEQMKDILYYNQEQLNDCLNKIFDNIEWPISKKLEIFINRLHQKFSFSREEDDLLEDSSYLIDLKFSHDVDRLTLTQLVLNQIKNQKNN